jgi:hypothetical protein
VQGASYRVKGTRKRRKGAPMGKFQDLKVWKRGKDLAVSIYKLTGHGIFSKDYGLRDQIRRAAVSIPSNIAEFVKVRSSPLAVIPCTLYLAPCT